MDAVCLDISKVFDRVPYNILLEKLVPCGLNGYALHWVKDWLDSWAQRAVHRVKLSWWPVITGVSGLGSGVTPTQHLYK